MAEYLKENNQANFKSNSEKWLEYSKWNRISSHP